MFINPKCMTLAEEQFLLREMDSLQKEIKNDKSLILNESAEDASVFRKVMDNKDDIILFYKRLSNKDISKEAFDTKMEVIANEEPKLRSYIGMKEPVNIGNQTAMDKLNAKYNAFQKSPWWYKALKIAAIFTLGIVGLVIGVVALKTIISSAITTILASIVAGILMYNSAKNALDVLKTASGLGDYKTAFMYLIISFISLVILNHFLVDSAMSFILPVGMLIVSAIFITIFIYYLMTYIKPLVKYSVKTELGVPLDAE